MTTTKEDYIVEIYRLGKDGGLVTNKELSIRLNLSAPTISEMINTLKNDGYINYTPYKGVSLTKLGEERAIKIIRSHRIWEVFLTKHLKYENSEAHILAHELEHVTGTDLVMRLEEYLDFPKFCPDGSPIPSIKEN